MIASQPELALDAFDLATLREAYTKAGYRRRGISFATALASKPLRIALRCYAEALARKRTTVPH